LSDRTRFEELVFPHLNAAYNLAFLRNAESKTLAHAIAALPLAYREVLILREMEELSYKEIVSIADIPIGTVMSRLARARGQLQRSPLSHAAN
jgi:RNA polymerase sigma factor (sigma-70 family)